MAVESASPISKLYRESFLLRCIEFVQLGYARLDRCSLATQDETTITGLLVDAMKASVDALDRPDWAHRFAVVDDEPKSVGGKTGKRRPRVDLTIQRICPRPSLSFYFEAKRLNSRGSGRNYLGNNGMLAVVEGHYGDLPFTGMIGYVQAKSCNYWMNVIWKAISENPLRYHAVEPVKFSFFRKTKSPEPVFRTAHRVGERCIEVAHAMFDCQ